LKPYLSIVLLYLEICGAMKYSPLYGCYSLVCIFAMNFLIGVV